MLKVELDISRGELLRDGVAMRLRPKTLAVLAELHARRNEVVSQNDLRNAVWGQQHGRETGPKQCIRELRRLLDDNPGSPRFIETVGRRGYRLVGRIDLLNSGRDDSGPAPLCVGRAAELAMLADSALMARSGKRAVTLVSGEAGSGKSRLLEAFAATLSPGASFWTAAAHCIPHPGAREPYGPLIAILSQLATEGSTQKPVLRLLETVAPSWKELLPELRAAPALAAQPVTLVETLPDSMLREFTAIAERLSQQQPGVIILEDLHWADQSTLAWLLFWAQSRAAARILVIGTYRFDELDNGGDLKTTIHHLKRMPGFSLLALDGLDHGAVTELLNRRFPDSNLPPSLARELTRRTEGHAILVDAVVEQWHREGVLEPERDQWAPEGDLDRLMSSVTRSVQSFIADEIGRLNPDERLILEIASVASNRFSAPMLNDGRIGVEETERMLDRLASSRRFLERSGIVVWPDGSEATGYVFRHALYREALYEGIPAANRQGLHERIGSRLETAFKAQAAEMAPVLANHFERAADHRRAAIYRGLSGLTALKRGAANDAAGQFRRALQSFAACDPDPETRGAECRALLGLGAALIVGDSFTTLELREVCERAATLAEQASEPATIVPALAGLWNHHISRADLAAAGKLAKVLHELTGNAPASYAMVAHNAAGQTSFFGGDLMACLPHIAAVCDTYDARNRTDAAVLFGEDPGIVCRQYAACVLQLLGQGEAAEQHFSEGMKLAHRLDQPFSQAQMLWAGALIARERGAPELVLERANSLISVCETAEIPYWLPYGQMLAGWAKVVLGDHSALAQICTGLDAYEAMDVQLTRPYGLALYAEAAGHCGQPAEGLKALWTALQLARQTGERWYEPEIYLLWASLSIQIGRMRNISLPLGRALALARRQRAGLCERRARELQDRIRMNSGG